MNSQLPTRSGFRWSINEVLALQREFELLGLTIDEIAQKHNRTTNAIIFKLDQEGFADYNELYSNLNNSESDDNSSEISLEYNYDDNDSDTEYNSENDLYNLSHRVNNIEKNIVDLNITIKNMWSYIKQSNQIGSGLN
jgi:hypothetical protein